MSDTTRQRLTNALAVRSSAVSQREQQAKMSRDLKERHSTLVRQKAELIEAEKHEAGLRLLDGEEAAPPNAKRRKALAALEVEIEPLAPGIELSTTRERELALNFCAAEQEVANAAFAHASAIKASSAKAIKDGLGALVAQIVSMAAADSIAHSLSEMQPTVGPDQFPDEFSGEFVARKLIGGLTHFVRPDTLADVQFAKAVSTAAEQITSEFLEGHQP